MTHMMSSQDIAQLDDEGLAAWNAHDAERFCALLADNFTWIDDGVPDAMTTRDQALEYCRGWFTAFPDMQIRSLNRIIADEQVAAELEFSGTNTGPLVAAGQQIPATGKAVVSRGTYFVKARDGRIVEFHTHPDLAGLMAQLGLLPG